MKLRRVITNVLFGSCVTIVTLSANAEQPEPIALDEFLDTYQLDCARKDEQVQFLQSFRQSKWQMITARFESVFTPRIVKSMNTGRYNIINKIGKGDVNWIIDQKLHKLKNNCS